MAPSGRALEHPFAQTLLEYARNGCPADTGEQWTMEQLEAAIKKGAHPSAQEPEAARQLINETLEKVEQGFARLIPLEDLKKDPPKNLKMSPIAAIPHKSRGYRAILDLSHGVRIGLERRPSVNETTNPTQAPKHSMDELGNVLPRIIYTLATAPAGIPIQLAKVDLKDGFWRVEVDEEEAWAFCYILPRLNPDDPIMVVVPSALQMGWTDSPPYFCAASETARDVAETLFNDPKSSLPPHPLEHYMLPPEKWGTPHDDCDDWTLEKRAMEFVHLFEVYMDDFIGLAQTEDAEQLRGMSRDLLTAIHSVFPPPNVTGHDGPDPISEKKLFEGDGIWDTRKEILGWIFDGVRRCIELPEAKVEALLTELHQARRRGAMPEKEFEKFRGRLRHACLGIPAGRSLMGPIDNALARCVNKRVAIKRNKQLHLALGDFHTLIKAFGNDPTFCRELVPGIPGYEGFVDASKLGAGGVWLSGTEKLQPTVWRLEFPEEIRRRVISFDNPTGDITNSDLEMAGLLVEFIVLEYLVPLEGQHAAAWCDNTPTVSWATKLSSSKSMIAARLIRALALRLRANRASPLIPLSIAGIDNIMADISSRLFSRRNANGELFKMSDDEFLHFFNSRFPLPQGNSWRYFRLSSKISSLIFSELLGKASTMGSWLRITARGGDIGTIGPDSPHASVEWTPCSRTSRPANESTSSAPLLSGSGEVITPAAKRRKLESAAAQFKSRFVPSARRSNWTENPIRHTAQKDDTGSS